MDQLQYCRLCLKPENVNRLELKFTPNLCYCRESNFHRQCLIEWIESTGFTNCHRCQCDYNVSMKPPSFFAYIWSTREILIRTQHKLLRSINIIHITLIILYVILYIDRLAFYPLKLALIILMLIRCYLNAKSMYYFIQSVFQNYSYWRQRHSNVLLND